jgi:hypothetical protein
MATRIPAKLSNWQSFVITNGSFVTRNTTFLARNQKFVATNDQFACSNDGFDATNDSYLARNALFLVTNFVFLATNDVFLARNDPFLAAKNSLQTSPFGPGCYIRPVNHFAVWHAGRMCTGRCDRTDCSTTNNLSTGRSSTMSRFPTREADVASLANRLVSGLREHTEDFPNPPYAADDLEATLKAYQDSYDAAVSAQGTAASAAEAKRQALDTLTERMKVIIRYAEDAVSYDSGKLKNLGWNGRKSRSELELPGQARVLESKREGPGWVLLEWKKPFDGGTPAAYHIQVQREGDKEWRDVATCFETTTVVTNQERGVELKYRVVSANRAGTAVPSNAVTVVL